MSTPMKITLAVAFVGAVTCAIGVLRLTGIDGEIEDYPSADAGTPATVTLDEGSPVGYLRDDCGYCDGRGSEPLPRLTIRGNGASPPEVKPHDDRARPRVSPSVSDDFAAAYDIQIPKTGEYEVDLARSATFLSVSIGPSVEGRRILGWILTFGGGGLAALAIAFAIAGWFAILLGRAAK